MSSLSTTRKEIPADDAATPDKGYLTTTQLARLCGVSRFTIRNWINQGRISAIRTLGKHYRIPASEAISLLQAFHLDGFDGERAALTSGSLRHCWEYPRNKNCAEECGDCLIHGSQIDYCFVVVRLLGNDAVRCKGDCLNCGYFEDFFGLGDQEPQVREPSDRASMEVVTRKAGLLHGLVRGVGRGIGELKKRVGDRSAGEPPRANGSDGQMGP